MDVSYRAARRGDEGSVSRKTGLNNLAAQNVFSIALEECMKISTCPDDLNLHNNYPPPPLRRGGNY